MKATVNTITKKYNNEPIKNSNEHKTILFC